MPFRSPHNVSERMPGATGRMLRNVLGLFLLFALCFFVFQWQRERTFAAEKLSALLSNYNARLYARIDSRGVSDSTVLDFLGDIPQRELRVTVMDTAGNVLYDNIGRGPMENHASREEIVAAHRTGQGFTVRQSSSVHRKYLYQADELGGYILRSALPYDLYAARMLTVDHTFIWFLLAIGAIIVLVVWRYVRTQSQLHAERRRRALEEETRELKRQLTHNIAHELKTPVSSVRGFLELLIGHPDLTPGQRQQFLERAAAQTERLSALVQDISLLNNLEEAQGLFGAEEVDITALVGEVTADCSVALAAQAMSVTVRIPGGCRVQGNYSLLYSVFRNLLDNAASYAGEGAEVTIECYREDHDQYYFLFADNGAGVEPSHLERLFERFYRIDKGRSRKAGGTGLGLAIVKNAVIFHGGNITAGSGPSGGLEFQFTIRKRLPVRPKRA